MTAFGNLMELSQYMGRDEKKKVNQNQSCKVRQQCQPIFFLFCTLAVENQQ